MNILTHLQETLRKSLHGLYPQALADPGKAGSYVAMLKPAQAARFGDYQANCAMPLAKVVGKPPRDVAQEIAGALDRGDLLEEPEVAGPGFINLRLRQDWLGRQLQALAQDPRLGVEPVAQPRTIVIDYSSPNVAKPMHVGHLRSTIIGAALARLLGFLGHHVITDNHLGDWGAQFGILLYGYKHHRDEEALARDPVAELARLYIHVRGLFRSAGEDSDDPSDPVQEACRQETARLHAGDEENVALWKQFIPWCHEELNRIYRLLDVQFDHTLGESFYQPVLPQVVADLEQQGIAVPSAGATVVFLGENEPPALVRKSDGAFTYMTTDLATIKHRVQEWHADEILYVVDFRQAYHFRQLFEVARRWGCDRVKLEHVSFGSVLGPDRKPIKTREGGAPPLEELLGDAIRRARTVHQDIDQQARDRGEEVPELSPEELQTLYQVVGIGAVKYADLCQNRESDYVYDPDKMMAMDGNTATYMQYAYVRNRGIFRKGAVDEQTLRTAPPLPLLDTEEERALAVQLLRFSEALTLAASDHRPSQVTAYLWDLARTYSGFFTNCPVLKAPTPELRQGRLLLCDLTARVIQKGLALLGIHTVERM